jgi:3'(2'), 5'-bisphosphate nucleotidase
MTEDSVLASIEMNHVLALAKQAGRMILAAGKEMQDNGVVEVEFKEDESPVTAVDDAANQQITEGLRALTPDIPILSEEGTPEERAAALQSEYHWVVDPLDGTKTFIAYAKGEKERTGFGVHIGLVRGNTPIAGVAYFPAMENDQGVAYYTGNDGKAYKQVGEAAAHEIHVSDFQNPRQNLRAAVHYKQDRHPATIANRSYDAMTGVGGQRICFAAEGAVDVAWMADIYPEHAYKQWDVAAAHAILKAAGGELVSCSSRLPVRYDDSEYKVPACVAGSCKNLRALKFMISDRVAGSSQGAFFSR